MTELIGKARVVSDAIHKARTNLTLWETIHRKNLEELGAVHTLLDKEDLSEERRLQLSSDRAVFTARRDNARLNINSYTMQLVGLIPKRTMVFLRALMHHDQPSEHPVEFAPDIALLRALGFVGLEDPAALSLDGTRFLFNVTALTHDPAEPSHG